MSDKYELIDAEYANAPAGNGHAPTITCMCRWLGVSKSGFYEWRSRPESATTKRQEGLRLLITAIFDDSDGTYGYRRVAAQLARQGVVAGLELIRKLMRELGLVACQPRPWRPSTTEQGAAGPIPDLVNRDFSAGEPGQKMVGDITYIATWQGWEYLATVIDCATRKVIGWAMGDNYKTPLITAAIEMAARNVDLPAGAVFHSDRGSNYTRPSSPVCSGACIMTLDRDRPEILHPPEHSQACCAQQTITVPPEVNAKTAQKHDYPSAAWRRSYARRTGAERGFATAKDPATNTPPAAGAASWAWHPSCCSPRCCSSPATSGSSPPGTTASRKTPAAQPPGPRREPGAAAARPSPCSPPRRHRQRGARNNRRRQHARHPPRGTGTSNSGNASMPASHPRGTQSHRPDA